MSARLRRRVSVKRLKATPASALRARLAPIACQVVGHRGASRLLTHEVAGKADDTGVELAANGLPRDGVLY